MASNKQLQRRAVRRTSLPTSPVIFERRSGDRVARPDPVSPQDYGSAITGESPSLELHMPSPSFDFPGLTSPASAHDPDDSHYGVWERPDKSRTKLHDDNYRSSPMSTPGLDGHTRSSRYAQTDSFKSSPLMSSYKDSSDFGGRSESRDKFYERSHVPPRNFSTTSLATERSSGDDTGRTTMPKKSRLNLLNPMSLLARRRSSQNSKLEDLNINPSHAPSVPDFDPSIRGNIVHDFSTPRQRTPRRDAFPSPAPPLASSSPAMHSPMFREHFQDETRVVQPMQTAYLHNKQLEAPAPQSMPAFARRLPTQLPSGSASDEQSFVASMIPHPDVPPPPPPKGTPSPVLEIPSIGSLPKHTKSTSSRFSFQMAEYGSAAQEKILEDKHREHFTKDAKTSHTIDDIVEDDYDDYDPDAQADYEEEIGVSGLEDELHDFAGDGIPIRNIEVQTSQRAFNDSDYNSFSENHNIPSINLNNQITNHDANSTSQQYNIQQFNPKENILPSSATHSFHFTPHSNILSPMSTQHSSEPTPRDAEGFPIGIANTNYSPSTNRPNTLGHELEDLDEPIFFEGLKISTTENFGSSQVYEDVNEAFDDADLYFDDGEFDGEFDNVEDGGNQFNESMLDDSTHIRDIPAENAMRYKAAIEKGGPDAEVTAVNPADLKVSTNAFTNSGNPVQQSLPATAGYPAEALATSSAAKPKESPSLTEVNLAAYHDALAQAANKAEANGRFNRQVSFSEASEPLGNLVYDSSQSGLASHESRFSFNVGSGGITDDDGFGFDDFDDGLDDDLMIAEANAEALENDDDGFYGQEFGFYARANSKESSGFMNGGYFASRGQNGVKRSHSGKANFQEPNLTPITERSEWSARNSVASLPLHGGVPMSAQSLPSPGLSQLLDSPLLEDDMSLSVLMRLRRGAFGGSSTSINSLGEKTSLNSSPLAHMSTYNFPPPADSGHGRKLSTSQSLASSMSIVESSEEDDEFGDRNTMTQNTPRKNTAEHIPQTPQEQITIPLASHASQTGKKSNHSRNSSGAESVSYTQDNSGRWILERRRTRDDGELEIIGREYLAGARI